jgi:hypothetical protein
MENFAEELSPATGDCILSRHSECNEESHLQHKMPRIDLISEARNPENFSMVSESTSVNLFLGVLCDPLWPMPLRKKI